MTDQRKAVMPPSMTRLTRKAYSMGYGDPQVEIGDIHGVPAVRVTLKDSEHFRDVEATVMIGRGYEDTDGKIVRLNPQQAEYLAARSALAEALVLAMAPEARRDRNGATA